MNKQLSYLLAMLTALVLSSCFTESTKLADMEEYDGPLVESGDVQIIVSDSAVIKIKITGAKQLQHQNGDLEFPEGLDAVIYDEFGDPVSELTAEHGYQKADENIYRATGNVFVTNLKKKETLSTEELFWNPDEQRIYTDKFVTIETEDALIPGEGLEAPQDFSTYNIKKPQDAIFKIKDDNGNQN